MPKRYTGDDPEMKYLKRSALCMTADDFFFAGKNMSKREHVLDLRLPGAENTFEPPNYPKESDFDAIRINSFPILRAVARLPTIAASVTPTSVPYVFWKPFLPLTENLAQLEQHLMELKDELAQKEPEPQTPKVTKPPAMDLKSPEHEDPCPGEENSEPGNEVSTESDTEPDDVWEINDIEYFIDFVENVLKEDLRIRQVFRSKGEDEVSFNNLYNLFQIGPESYVAGYFENTLRAFQMVAFTGGGHHAIEGGKKTSGKGRDKGLGGSVKTTRREFHLVLLYLDFNGSKFCVVRKDVKIHPFLAKRPIRYLPVFPLNYLPELELAKLKKRGTRFLKFAEKQAHGQGLHRHYTGLSLNQFRGSKEDVDAEVVVDHNLALQQNSDWAPKADTGILSYDDDPPKSFMNSGSSDANSGGRNDPGIADAWLKQANDLVYQEQSSRFMELCNSPAEEAVTKLEGMKIIAHVRVFAFVLRSRKWVKIDIDKTEPVRANRNGFESLVLPPGHKEVVQALVKMHSPGQASSAEKIEQAPQMDLVRGKGKGLILLLHGAPGVGKTSTAECVAAYAKRPLFPITCGDIGYEPQDVETNLENNFRLAHQWGCVLLLDEADVFLARRNKHDLKRNSMVSVFLRVLEYYSGILFLTTNRVGTLDEAFKSRIHISLYYPTLDLEASTQIWGMNLQRLKTLKPEAEIDIQGVMGFARASYQQLNWNGRQIRNAFQTAYALAEYQTSLPTNQGSSTTITRLTADHFSKVAQITQNFENYLVDIYGGQDDSDRAKHDQLRHDHWSVPPGNTGPAPQQWGSQMPQAWAPGSGQDGRGTAGSVNWSYPSHGQNPPPAQMPTQYHPQNMSSGVVWQGNPSMAQGQNPFQNPTPMQSGVQQPPSQGPSGPVFGTGDICAPLQTPAPYKNPANTSPDDEEEDF